MATKQKVHFANSSRGSNGTKIWQEPLGHLYYRELTNLLPVDLKASDENV